MRTWWISSFQRWGLNSTLLLSRPGKAEFAFVSWSYQVYKLLVLGIAQGWGVCHCIESWQSNLLNRCIARWKCWLRMRCRGSCTWGWSRSASWQCWCRALNKLCTLGNQCHLSSLCLCLLAYFWLGGWCQAGGLCRCMGLSAKPSVIPQYLSSKAQSSFVFKECLRRPLTTLYRSIFRHIRTAFA